MAYYSIAFVLLISVIYCAALYTDICSLCKCKDLEDIKSETFIAVHCGCTETSPDLQFFDIQGNNVSQISRFTVANCSRVTFESNSFRSVSGLHSLSVISCNTVSFNTGVFTSLKELIIDDVHDLILEDNAFMGAHGVSTITIRKSTIKDVPLYALYNMEGIKKLEIVDVTLGTVRKQSIRISMNVDRSNFSIVNSTIKNIEDGGIIINAKEIHFTSSYFASVQRGGIRTASNQVYIQNCTFGESLFEDSFQITSQTVNISNNIFQMFYTGMMSHIHPNRQMNSGTFETSRTIIKNRIIRLNTDDFSFLSNTSNDFENTYITENRIPCDCKLSVLITAECEKCMQIATQNYCFECENNVLFSKLAKPCSANTNFNISLECKNFEDRNLAPTRGGRDMDIRPTTETSTMYVHYEEQKSRSGSKSVSISVSLIITVFLVFIVGQ